jgi:hypothetical protein
MPGRYHEAMARIMGVPPLGRRGGITGAQPLEYSLTDAGIVSISHDIRMVGYVQRRPVWLIEAGPNHMFFVDDGTLILDEWPDMEVLKEIYGW